VLSQRRDSLKIYYGQSQEMEDYVSHTQLSEPCQLRITSLSEPIEHISSSEATNFSASHEMIAKIICIAATQLHHIKRDLIFSRRFPILMKVYYYRFYYRNFCFVIFWMTLLSKHRLALFFS
jgi:hypothetical protein